MSATLTEPPARRTDTLSRTVDGRPVPDFRTRLGGRTLPDDRWLSWLVALGVTVFAGVLRFWKLGRPDEFAFDETYYAKDGWSLWKHGYAQNWVEDANERILENGYTPDLQTGDPTMVVHPEIGKWLIGAGQQLFGFEPFGWRFASAVVGTLMVLVMVRLARRLTGSTLLGAVAGVLLAVDGLLFTLSRLALLDIFVGFFLLAGVAALVVDRDWGRARLARLMEGRAPHTRSDWGPVRGMLWRPWRLLAGVMFGLAVASKWSALIPLAGFGILVVLWDTGARRALDVRHAFLRASVADGLLAFLYLVGVTAVVYIASWAGWIYHSEVYEAKLSQNNYGPYWGDYTKTPAVGFVDSLVQGVRSLYHYHRDVWQFHSEGLVEATHTYASDPRGWLTLHRPVNVATDLGIEPGDQGCTAPADSTCLRQVIMIGNPVIWWVGIVALLHSVWRWVVGRDWRHGIVIVGLLTTWVPFFRYSDRPIFSFYAATIIPFTVLALTLLVGRLVGPEHATHRHRLLGSIAAGSIVVLALIAFAWFWPVYTFELITTPEWLERIWFKSWI